MTSKELERYRNEESYEDYLEALEAYWKENTESEDGWENLVSSKFMTKHTVDGTVSREKAIDVCWARSADGSKDFVSTLIPADLMREFCRVVAKKIRRLLLNNKQKFQDHPGSLVNVLIPRPGMVFTAWYRKKNGSKKSILVEANRQKVIVGINEDGFIVHFHGDSKYKPSGPFYDLDGKRIENS
ncbi:MAG TPA: hypothetical protein VLE27_16995 [Thermoanaerobaculia bacterium]|nr:hypothetical protein [Thermoanaerobaculia bacterium]